MDTKAVANKWKEMCSQGQNLECVNELYAENVVSKEISGNVITGRQNVWNKGKEWMDAVENFHSSTISEPLVAGNFFTATMAFDCTYKERGRQVMEEVCVFEVKDGKIASEHYFYNI